jgi:hypothetical protein
MRNPHAAGAGASNWPVSRDEVSTRKTLQTQPCHEVDTWAPWSTAGERAQRLRLYQSRDICGARAARTDGWTHLVFKAAEELAGDYVWRRSTEAELRCVADSIVRMIQSGVELEHGGIRDA